VSAVVSDKVAIVGVSRCRSRPAQRGVGSRATNHRSRIQTGTWCKSTRGSPTKSLPLGWLILS
jgi:hypothetical protein